MINIEGTAHRIACLNINIYDGGNYEFIKVSGGGLRLYYNNANIRGRNYRYGSSKPSLQCVENEVSAGMTHTKSNRLFIEVDGTIIYVPFTDKIKQFTSGYRRKMGILTEEGKLYILDCKTEEIFPILFPQISSVSLGIAVLTEDNELYSIHDTRKPPFSYIRSNVIYINGAADYMCYITTDMKLYLSRLYRYSVSWVYN